MACCIFEQAVTQRERLFGVRFEECFAAAIIMFRSTPFFKGEKNQAVYFYFYKGMKFDYLLRQIIVK